MIPNTITIVGTVKRDAFRSEGGKFAAANVEVEVGRDRAWLDVVAFSEMTDKIGALKEGQKVTIEATPQSNKRPEDPRGWRLRFVAASLEVAK